MKMGRAWLGGMLALVMLVSCGGGTAEQDGTTAAAVTTEEPAVTTAPGPDAAAIAESGELWLEAGMACYTGEIALTLDMAEFLADSGGWIYLQLSDDLFFVDPGTAGQMAGHFFTFVMENYGWDALFDVSRRPEYKDAFVKSYFPEKSYTNPAEEIFAAMDCRSENGQYIITLAGADYITAADNYLSGGSRTLILYNGLAWQALAPALTELDPTGKYFDTTRKLIYDLALGGDASLTQAGTGSMTVSTYDAMLHQTLHAYGLTDRRDDHHWLTEGLCEYFGKALGYDQWVTSNYHYMAALAAAGRLTSMTAEVYALRYQREAEAYTAMGGSIADADSFSMPLLLHAKARCDQLYGEPPYPQVCCLGMDTLTEAEAASLTMYLIDRHGIDAVLAVWADYDSFASAFGGSLDDIMAAWQAWLAKASA